MIKLSGAQVWVHDQDEAPAFYTEKLGMELRQDVTVPEMGDFRWLTVGLPGHETEVVLMAIPGPPILDEAVREEIHALMAKGFAQTLFLTTDDCQKSCEELTARGVEFTENPEERPMGSTPASATRRATPSGSPKHCPWSPHDGHRVRLCNRARPADWPAPRPDRYPVGDPQPV